MNNMVVVLINISVCIVLVSAAVGVGLFVMKDIARAISEAEVVCSELDRSANITVRGYEFVCENGTGLLLPTELIQEAWG